MVVTAVFVYPVKSARAVEVASAATTARGLAGDRRWMVADPSGGLISQREAPALARLVARITDDGVALSSDGHGAIEVTTPRGDARREVTVWGDRIAAAPAAAAADTWLTALLGQPAHLVHLPDDSVRPVDPRYGRPGDQVSFADGYPLLITTEASLAELNRRMDSPLPMDRFRPNLVIGGTAPFAEDGWRRIQIGDLVLRVVKPCDRCVVTTTDQQSGDRGLEPLRTLASFRRQDGGVMFGQNAIPEAAATVRRGDPVRILAG